MPRTAAERRSRTYQAFATLALKAVSLLSSDVSEPHSRDDLRGVDVVGPADAPPIVFLHGVMFTRKLWTLQRDALSEEFRVAVPDLPGHGERSEGTFRMERALSVVDEVVETVADGRATVVGLSLGGYLATAYAHRHPEKVDALVISGSSANPVGALDPLTKLVSGASRLATKSDLVDRGVQWLASRWVQSRELPAAAEAEILNSGFYPKQFGEAGFELAGTDFRTAFASYPGPSLVLNGRWDLLNRLGESKHVDAGPRADRDVLAGAGHVCNLERPTEYVAAVRRVVEATADRSREESRA